MSNHKVAPLTDELIAAGRTVKCTKCRAWVVSESKRTGQVITGRYATTMELVTGATPVCHACDGRGYITPEQREEIRSHNAYMNRREVLVDIIQDGIDKNVGADHEDYKRLRADALGRFLNIAMVHEGWDLAVPGRGDAFALKVLKERTGWDFLAWLDEEVK